MALYASFILQKAIAPKQASPAIDNVLNGSVPDLIKKFSEAVQKCGVTKDPVCAELIFLREKIEDIDAERIHDAVIDEVARGTTDRVFPSTLRRMKKLTRGKIGR